MSAHEYDPLDHPEVRSASMFKYGLAFFIGMTFCMRLAFPVAPAWQVLAGMLGFGAMIELVQGSLPGRIPSPEDFGLDTLGALAGLMLFSCVDRSPS